MIDSLYIATNQITNLISNINKKNYKQTVGEINQLLDQFKSDAEHHLFRVLFSVIDLSSNNDSKNVKDTFKCQLLISEINTRISKENFPSLICRAIDNPLSCQKSLRPSNQLLPQLSKLLKLNRVHEVVLGLSLLLSNNKETVSFANYWVRQKMPDLLRSYVDGDNGGKEGGVFNEISMEILHFILSNLLNDKDKFGVGNDQITAFCTALTKDLPKEGVPSVLSAAFETVSDFISEKGVRNRTYTFNDVNYLANLLEEMGPISTQNTEELYAILADFDSKLISAPVIAKCICMFMRISDTNRLNNESEILGEWNLEKFFFAVFEKNPSMNKRDIIDGLDCKEFDASSKIALKILQSCIIHCVDTFPTDFFYSQWKNCAAQFSFLKSCLINQDIIFLSSWAHRVCDLSVLNIKVDDEQFENQISHWKNLDYIDGLLRLSDNLLLREVNDLFEIPMSKFPHVLICSLMQSSVVNELRSRLLLKLFTTFVTNTTVPSSFFHVSWKNIDCRPLILSALFEYYKESENHVKNLSCVFRIAEIVKDVNAVQFILPNSSNRLYSNIFQANSSHFRYEVVHFALDIVIYCTQKNTDFLSQWVSELLLKEEGQVLNFKALVSYVHLRYPKVIENEDSKFLVPRELILDAQCLYEFLRNLDQTGKAHFQSVASIKPEMHLISQMMTKLTMILNHSTVASGGPSGSAVGQNIANVTPKVSRNKLDPTRSAFVPQSKMNRTGEMPLMSEQGRPGSFVEPIRPDYAQLASTGDMKTQEAMSTTSKYVTQSRPFMVPGEDKIQGQTIEQEIDKNLKLLFEGSVTVQTMVDLYCNPLKSKREHLWSLINVLMEELRYIYQYPVKQGKIYSDLFIQILSLDNNLITKSDIAELYNSLVTTQSSLNNSNNNGREIVERIINFVKQSRNIILSLDPVDCQSSSTTTAMTTTSLVSLTNVIAPNVFSNMDSPPENVTEKVFFIINNVSKMNVQEKATQLSEVVTQDYVIWFAQYIVMKRVTTEANFHDLFIQLIDCMADQLTGLKDKVLTETYRNIKILLFNMKVDLSDFNDRQLLKNLGKFLGMITLAKNKPILHDDMNLKDLLYEAFNMGHIELHYVVPFVTKTLEAAKDSIVFRPPCPWTMAIMKVLKELHEVETVKLNLKFEVEILCRNLKLDFNKLTAAFFLNDQTVRIETSLCRIVPSNAIQSSGGSLSTSAAAAAVAAVSSELLHSESVNNMRNTFDSHQARIIGNAGTQQQQQQQQHQQQQRSQQQQQQSIETLEANRGSIIRPPSMSYQQQQLQQSMQQSVNSVGGSSSSVAMHNYQRSTGGQDQYYPGPVNGQTGQYSTGGQTVGSMAPPTTVLEHGHGFRTLNISYDDLNTTNIANYLNIEDIPAPILNQIPNLRNQLTATMERIVLELISPLYDRCAKITIGTVDQLVVKDFGVDCDLNTIKQYAFGMCRNLTAGLCLVTAREIVGVNLNTAIKQTILGEYRHVNIQDKEQVDNFANKIVSTNNEICVAFLQKVVSEKAIGELEKKLNSIVVPDNQKRNQYKPSGQELQVYECFSRNIPGFQSLTLPLLSNQNMPGSWASNNVMHQQQQQQQQRSAVARQYNVVSGGGSGTNDSMVENPISRMISEIERQMNSISNIARNDSIIISLRQIVDIAYLALRNKDPTLIHKLMRETVASFMTMYHSQLLRDSPQGLEIMERLKEAHMYSLRIMQPYEDNGAGVGVPGGSGVGVSGGGGGYMSVNKQVTLAWTSMEEPKNVRQNGPGKWNGEAFSELLKTHVISLPSMDMFLAKKIHDNNLSALIFVLDLLKYFVTGDKREFTVLNEFDLSATIDAINVHLAQYATSNGASSMATATSTGVGGGLVTVPGQVKLQSDVAKLLAVNMTKICNLMDLGTLEKTVSSIYLYNGISLSREFDDPPTMPERSEIMIRMWMEHYWSPNQRDQNHINSIIVNMNHNQLIHNEETFVRFLRLATVYVVERAHKSLKTQDTSGGGGTNNAVVVQAGGGVSVVQSSVTTAGGGPTTSSVGGLTGSNTGSSSLSSVITSGSMRTASYTEIDAYALLVSVLVLRSTDIQTRTCLLNKSLGIIAGTLLQEHEVRRDWFHPMPFQRILIMLFNELQSAFDDEPSGSSSSQEWQLQLLTAFTHTFHVIRPKCAPSFVFSWLELISHRSFIGRMLAAPHSTVTSDHTHPMYCQLLSDLYSFLRPYLENLHLPRPVQMIYKGAVSLTCLMMHDFPDLLIHYHSLLCTLLPVNCYQLRNIILCTTPKNIKLPDVTRPLHVEQLSQIEDPPGYCQYAGNRIKPADLRQELDSYLATRLPVKFLSELINGLKRKDSDGLVNNSSSSSSTNISVISAKDVSSLINVPEDNIGRSAYFFKSNGVVHYDVDLMNNVVLYLCITATRVLREKNIPLNINTIAHTAQMDIIQSLVLNLDNEGRFLLLNCMANQLRYPNSHSYYFIFTFLYLFAEQPQESVKEQITRVILERIIVNRPHPWGLLHLMNELFKNPLFWHHKFLHCSDEVEKILESVVKGCRGTVPPPALAPLQQSAMDEMNNVGAGITAES